MRSLQKEATLVVEVDARLLSLGVCKQTATFNLYKESQQLTLLLHRDRDQQPRSTNIGATWWCKGQYKLCKRVLSHSRFHVTQFADAADESPVEPSNP